MTEPFTEKLHQKGEQLMFKVSGTFCPSCGLQKAHQHLGWHELGKIVLTDLKCERCGHNSIIVRFTDDRREVVAETINNITFNRGKKNE